MSIGTLQGQTEEQSRRFNRCEKMSNLTFRPRPIDIHKQMPIVKTEENIDPYEGVSRSVPQMPTGMDPEDEEEQHIQEAIARSLQPSLQPSEIPTPNCRIVEAYINEKVEPWEPTPTFLLFHDPTESELEQMVEYDLDPEDTKFLQELNSPKKQLTEDALEFLIDRLEKFKRRCKLNGETNFTVAKVEKLLVKERHNHNIKPAALAAVFKYWLKKRQRIKVALIPRFQKPPDFNDPSPLVAFRPREPAIKPKKIHNRKNDSSAFNKLTQLRREFERARMLLEMIKKREKTKRERIGVLRDIFEYKLTEPASEREKKKRRNDEKSGTTSKPAKRSKIDRTYGFDVETSSSSEPSSPMPSSPAPPPVDTPELIEMIRKPPPCPYPVYLGKRIAVGGDVPLFRGRARIGRGGRLIFDRYSIPWVTLRANERYPISEEEWAQAMEEEEEAEEENETETNRAGFWGTGESEEKATTKQEEESGDLDGRDEYPLQQNGIQGEESRNGGEIIEMEEEEEEDKESDGEMGNAASKGREFVGFEVRKFGAEGKSEKQNGKRHAVQQKPYLTFELGNGESSFSKRLREITNMDGGSSDHERDEADDELSDTEANGKGWGVSQGNGVQHTGNAVK